MTWRRGHMQPCFLDCREDHTMTRLLESQWLRKQVRSPQYILQAITVCPVPPSLPPSLLPTPLQMRTRSQLFSQLVEDITQTMDDVDYPSLGLDGGKSPLRRRRRTLGGIFAKKESMSLMSAFPKRKSLGGSPKVGVCQR